MSNCGRAFRLLAVATVLAAVFAFPQAVRAQSLQDVFQQILQNPGDAELNLRYAELAIEQGEPRKALGAYERILLNDPENEAAKAGVRRIKRLLEPEITEWTFSLGGAYETNPRHEEDSGSDTDDGVLEGRATVRDERKLGGLRWRSTGQAFANWHPSIRELDFAYLGGTTGPLLPLGGEWRLRPALGTAVSFFDGEFLLLEGSAHLGLESDDAGAFKRLDIKLGYDQIGKEFSNEDAYFVDVTPRFAFPKLVGDTDVIVVRPKYRYNGTRGDDASSNLVLGDTFPLRYHQFGGGIDMFMGITEGLVAGINFDGNYRDYLANIPNEDKDRMDFLINPGAKLILPRLFLHQHTLRFEYEWEHRISNFGERNYNNHIVGLRSVWKFR